MQKFIRLEKNKDELNDIIIEWTLTTFCNFSCSYCEEYDNTKNGLPTTIHNIVNFLQQVRDLNPNSRILINILGGEPTLWNLLGEFTKECKRLNILTDIISNGSRSLKWWEENAKNMDRIHISYHPEHMSGDRLIELSKLLSSMNVNYFILLMMPLDYFDSNLILADELVNEIDDIVLRLVPIKTFYPNGIIEYSEEQKQLMKNYRYGEKYKPRDLQINTQKINLIYDEYTENTSRNNLLIDNLTKFKGWYCNAGIETLRVKVNGDIWRCYGKCGDEIGNINEQFTLPTEPVICNKNGACSCAHEISATKWKA